jgi:ABC-type dipeptide/oligopeptide/nickel transport system permease component
MRAYVIKRLLLAIPTLWGITLVTFLLMKSIPGDPVTGMVGERADPQVIAQMRENLGLDRPLIVQYMRYMRLLCKGELGRSHYTNRPVAASIAEKFPNTLKLAGAAVVVAVLTGLTLGMVAAVRRDTWLDRLCSLTASFGIATPVFWLALILVMVFSYALGWLPASGMGGGLPVFLILPALSLGTRSAAYLARITRSSMLEVMTQDYLRTARAKGLPGWSVTLKHAARNALIPVITLAGLDFGSYLNGSVLTETIFGWNGLGRFAMEAIMKRDYPVILGTVLVGAAAFIVVNLVVDVSYAFIDPRVGSARR